MERPHRRLPTWISRAGPLLLAAILLTASLAFGHDVSSEDAARISERGGMQLWLYVYLGAKHMVTGYDHVLFLLGVVFYLKTLREIARLVSFFALGHSLTLIVGVVGSFSVDPFLVDAVIGFSVAYKGFDNLDGFRSLAGERPNVELAVFVFGLFHGLGLATKLQQLGLSSDGLVANLLAFNVGVEIGQISALVVIVYGLRLLRRLREGGRQEAGPAGAPTQPESLATGLNLALITAGFALLTYQLGRFGAGA